MFDCLLILSLFLVKKNQEPFPNRSNIHIYETHNKENIDIPRCQLSRARESFPAVTIKMFSHLSNEIQSLELGKF